MDKPFDAKTMWDFIDFIRTILGFDDCNSFSEVIEAEMKAIDLRYFNNIIKYF